MARQNDLRTRDEARLDYEAAVEIGDYIQQTIADLRTKMLRVQQDKLEAWERLAVLDHEYRS